MGIRISKGKRHNKYEEENKLADAIIGKGYNYNINNEFHRKFKKEELSRNGKYPNIKAYINSYLESKSLNYDSDVSKYSMIYYKYAWDYLNEGSIEQQYKNNQKKYQIVIDDIVIYRGDTLNSMKHVFNHFVTCFYNRIHGKGKFKMTNMKVELLLNKASDLYIDTLFCDENLDKVPFSREILEQFDRFAAKSSTIGNQFPCPLFFNGQRSNYGKHDFPDLFLEAVYAFYNPPKGQNKKAGLVKLFAGVGKNRFVIEDEKLLDIFERIIHVDSLDELSELSIDIESHIKNEKKFIVMEINQSIYYCYNWLLNFKDWNEFVEKNFFQDFVDAKDSKGNYGKPIVLWEINCEGHSLDNIDYPEIGDEFVKYLRIICDAIENRSKMISNKFIETLLTKEFSTIQST